MSEVIFARTRHEYDSYADFWRLVEVSGYETCLLDEMDLERDAIYITTPINGETYPAIESARTRAGDRRAKLVWWNMERFDAPDARPLGTQLDEVLTYFDEAWSSDRLTSAKDSRLRFVVLGSHPEFRPHGMDGPKEYDFCHYSYAHGRRESLYATCRKRGLREAPNAWTFEEKDRVFRATRIIVNAQQYPAPVTAPLRFAVAAAYALPVISETVLDPYPLSDGVHLETAPIDELPARIQRLLMDPARAEKLRWELHRLLCQEWTFRRGVDEGVGRLLGESP